ncbi:MAG: hypothetical protein RXO22_04800 [Thermocladium sp.]
MRSLSIIKGSPLEFAPRNEPARTKINTELNGFGLLPAKDDHVGRNSIIGCPIAHRLHINASI